MHLAPIILFVFNRPWHTEQTLEALANNRLACDSTLFIYCDGPKSDTPFEELRKIRQVREIVGKKKWCKEVYIIEGSENKGLAESIISGVTDIVNRYGKIIVLEDDLITSTAFLQYMNDALNMYEAEEKVMHVSAYWFPIKHSNDLPEIFFYNTASCWGWGTWASSWSRLETNAELLKRRIIAQPQGIKRFTIGNSASFMNQLEGNILGRIKTWNVKWYATIFLNGGFSLHPNHSLVNNIGHDGSGMNCGTSSAYHWDNLANRIEVRQIPLVESRLARTMVRRFYKNYNGSSNRHRAVSFISKIVPKPIKRNIKSYLGLGDG